MGDYLGKAVVDGRVRYLSVSSIEKADTAVPGGCLRRWSYRYVGGKDEEENAKSRAAKEQGIKLHAEIAAYLRTGVKALSSLALRGVHFIPTPGPDLLAEHTIHTIAADGAISSALTAAGIPVVGFVDALVERPGEDPPGTVEVIDWKWKSSDRDRDGNSTLLREDQLVGTTQMAGYGEWLRRSLPNLEHVRLSHGYFPVRGEGPRKVTRLHVVDECTRTWQHAEAVARTIVDVAGERDPEKVPANLRACGAYGGCPHRAYCTASQATSLSNLFGGAATMGLLEQLKAQVVQEEEALRAAQPAVQATPVPPAPVPVAITVAPPPPNPLLQIWDKIASYNRGTPGLGGVAAREYAAARGYNLDPRAGVCGSGQLGKLMLFDVAQLQQLADELATGPAPNPPPAQHTPVMDVPVAGAPVATTVATSVGLLPPDAPASHPAIAAKPLDTAPEPAKKRGRPPKVAVVEAAPVATAPVPVATADLSRVIDAETGLAGPLQVFVDCIPNVEFDDLHDYIDVITDALAKRYCVDASGKPTLLDVRCAPVDGPLGYGRWKGAIRAMVLECPPKDGTHYLDTRGNEVAEVVADAMRTLCAARGGLFVRGFR